MGFQKKENDIAEFLKGKNLLGSILIISTQ